MTISLPSRLVVIAMDALDQLLVSCHDYFSPFPVSGYCYGRPGSTVGLLS